MTRNNALRWTAWLGTLIVANATKFGDVLQQTAADLIRVASPNAPDVEAFAWLATFIVLTGLCVLATNIMIALWGDPPPSIPVHRSAEVFDRYYANRKDSNQ